MEAVAARRDFARITNRPALGAFGANSFGLGAGAAELIGWIGSGLPKLMGAQSVPAVGAGVFEATTRHFSSCP